MLHFFVWLQALAVNFECWHPLKEDAMSVCLKSDMETFAVLHVPEDWNTVHDVEGLDEIPSVSEDWNTVHDVEGLDEIPSHYPWQGVVAYRARPIADLAR